MGSSTTNASVPVFVSTLWLSTRKDRPHRCNTVLFFSEGESSTTPSQHGRSTPVDSRFVLKSTYDSDDWNSPNRYLRTCSDMVALLFLGSPSSSAYSVALSNTCPDPTSFKYSFPPPALE